MGKSNAGGSGNERAHKGTLGEVIKAAEAEDSDGVPKPNGFVGRMRSSLKSLLESHAGPC